MSARARASARASGNRLHHVLTVGINFQRSKKPPDRPVWSTPRLKIGYGLVEDTEVSDADTEVGDYVHRSDALTWYMEEVEQGRLLQVPTNDGALMTAEQFAHHMESNGVGFDTQFLQLVHMGYKKLQFASLNLQQQTQRWALEFGRACGCQELALINAKGMALQNLPFEEDNILMLSCALMAEITYSYFNTFVQNWTGLDPAVPGFYEQSTNEYLEVLDRCRDHMFPEAHAGLMARVSG